ncbi:hypothetical protein F5Y15DRAFT_202706 [Xylariaceae sp. FL0016]|nr:hypothetical protein F5Y15DRAFT_202706 [Xylariaceae sp. FL0016]
MPAARSHSNSWPGTCVSYASSRSSVSPHELVPCLSGLLSMNDAAHLWGSCPSRPAGPLGPANGQSSYDILLQSNGLGNIMDGSRPIIMHDSLRYILLVCPWWTPSILDHFIVSRWSVNYMSVPCMTLSPSPRCSELSLDIPCPSSRRKLQAWPFSHTDTYRSDPFSSSYFTLVFSLGAAVTRCDHLSRYSLTRSTITCVPPK